MSCGALKVSFDLYRLRVAQPNQPNNRLGRRLAASLLCESLGQTSNLASSGPIDPDTNYINGLLCCVVLCCAFSGLWSLSGPWAQSVFGLRLCQAFLSLHESRFGNCIAHIVVGTFTRSPNSSNCLFYWSYEICSAVKWSGVTSLCQTVTDLRKFWLFGQILSGTYF